MKSYFGPRHEARDKRTVNEDERLVACNSSKDALRELLILREYGGRISKAPERVSTRANGIPYYFVEVTCKDGDTYIIEAYGEEAMELSNECRSTEERRVVLTT